MPMTRYPRFTWVSLEGTPGGACWSAQKDASASWSRFMVTSSGRRAAQTVAAGRRAGTPIFAVGGLALVVDVYAGPAAVTGLDLPRILRATPTDVTSVVTPGNTQIACPDQRAIGWPFKRPGRRRRPPAR